MNSTKFIGVWTIGMMQLPSQTRERIELAFTAMSKQKDDWFYKISIDNKDYFVADNGEFGFTAMLPEEY